MLHILDSIAHFIIYNSTRGCCCCMLCRITTRNVQINSLLFIRIHRLYLQNLQRKKEELPHKFFDDKSLLLNLLREIIKLQNFLPTRIKISNMHAEYI